MAAYQHASDFIPGHPPFSGVIMGGKWVPVAADNADWDAYVTWAAADPANVPDPWLPLSQGGIAIVLEEGQVAVGVMLDSLPEDQGGNPEPGLRPKNVDVPAVMVNEAVAVSANVGDVLSCTMGNWENEPKLYSSVWMSDGETEIEAGTFYTVQPGDAGHSLTSVVTATNDFGATEAPPSNAVAVAAVVVASEVAPQRSVPRHVEPEPEPEHENHRRGRHRE